MWFGVSFPSAPLHSSCCDLEQLNYFESHYSSVQMVYQSVFSRETEPEGRIYIFKESVHLIVGWHAGNPVEQAGRPEIQAGVDAAVFGAEFFFSWKSSVLLLRPSTGWIRHRPP